MTEQHKAALRTAVEQFNAGDEAYFDFYADDTVTYGLPGAPVADREGMIAFYRGFWSAFPKARVDVLELVGEGDLLAARFRISGELEGEFMGVQPDGRSVSVESMTMFRMTPDSRCVERWARLDETAFLTQLGLMPAPVTA
jgi:predicted ester cyclase